MQMLIFALKASARTLKQCNGTVAIEKSYSAFEACALHHKRLHDTIRRLTFLAFCGKLGPPVALTC